MTKADLDAELMEISRLQKQSGFVEPLTIQPAAEARRQGDLRRQRYTPQIGLPVESMTDIAIPGPVVDIPARIIRPKGEDAARPTVLYFHGGGFILGDINSHEGQARRIANMVDAVVVNVAYRLAPENPFPAAVDDAVAAFEWVIEHIDELGGDLDMIGVAGDSAGGNIAAVVAVVAAERRLPLAAQLLAYPVTNVTLGAMGRVTDDWLGENAAELATNPHVSPALSPHLADVAPIVLGFGDHDFLYDDNIAFDRELTRLGVTHITRISPTMPHGFMGMVSVSKGALDATNGMVTDFGRLLRGDDAERRELTA